MNCLYYISGLRKIALMIQNFIFNSYYKNRLGNKVQIFGYPIIVLVRNSHIRVGKNLVLISSPYFSEPGINHPVIIRTLNESAKIEIGDDVGMSGGGIIAAKQITIGDHTMIGANVVIMDTDFHPIQSSRRRYDHQNINIEAVTIGDNVFIGMNSLILKGVTLGNNTVIGAGSIVTKSIPPNSVAAGIPAEVIRHL